jgi:TRAP-type C4-dicarboxylate transport system substrate-binding protein
VVFDEVAEKAIAYSDRLNQESEKKYIALLEQELEVNYISGDDLQPFRKLTESVTREFVSRGVFTEEDLNAAQRIARGE